MAENGNGSALWKTLGPILIPTIATLAVAWFAFRGDSVPMTEHVRLVTKIEQMESTQRAALTEMSVKVAVLESKVDGIRRNLGESRYPQQKGSRGSSGPLPEEME